MSTSPTVSEAAAVPERSVRPQWELTSLVGNTPSIRLARSGDGLVRVKREGMGVAGTFHERVALIQLQRLAPGSSVSVYGLHSHTLAVAALGRSLGHRVRVVAEREESQRLLLLIRRFEPQLHFVDVALPELDSALPEHSIVLERNERSAHERAWSNLIEEVLRDEPLPPERWIVASSVLDERDFAKLLARLQAPTVECTVLRDDAEARRAMGGRSATRRCQTGHREGILLSPLGADIVDAAVDLALACQQRICAVLPEDGHRYLGWW